MSLRKIWLITLLIMVVPMTQAGGIDGLIGNLSEKLGVGDHEAKVGTSAVFSFVKEHVSGEDFGKVTQAIPDLEGLLRAQSASGNSGLGSVPDQKQKPSTDDLIGGLMDKNAGSETNGIFSTLGSTFKKLGLDPGLAAQFVPVIIDYVKDSPFVRGLLAKTLLGSGGSELLGRLTGKLGVNSLQAAGGAGAIFTYLKGNSSKEDFSGIAKAVPGIDMLMGAAPKQESDDVGSIVGGLLGDKAGSLGALASLTKPFSKLGLNEEMVAGFIPVVVGYVQEKGKKYAVDLVTKLLE